MNNINVEFCEYLTKYYSPKGYDIYSTDDIICFYHPNDNMSDYFSYDIKNGQVMIYDLYHKDELLNLIKKSVRKNKLLKLDDI